MSTTAFTGSIPEHYERSLAPLLFHWSAEELAARVGVPAGGRLLETACGTGIATEALRTALPADVDIVATDLNEAMLAVATARRGALPGVSFQVADAQELDFADASFDAVACQFGIMFMPDRELALREAARVLKPGGLLVFSTWDSLEANAPAGIACASIASHFPEDPPRFLELPFSMHDEDELRELALSAGLQDVGVHRVQQALELPSARAPAEGFVLGTPNIHAIEERGGADPETVIEGVRSALAEALGDTPMRTDLSCFFVTGRRS